MTKHLSCIALILCLFVAAASGFADTSIINVYDANGNLVTGDGRYYEYNDANQLVRVRQGGDQTGPVIAEYFYDSSGQRVKKIENGVVTYYVGKHFEKQVGGSNAGNTSYYFADDGERVAKKDPMGNISYYHLDHLDGINVVTDAAGTEVSRTDYLPFGDVRTGSTSSDKYAYTGKEKDKTDLYYFDARYNSPEFRHFTQADIAEPDYDDPQDLNRYAYVGNNPLSYVDYDGFKKKKHHSKKEEKILAKQRAAANAQKHAKKKEKEKQRAAAHYAKHHPASILQVGAGYSLASGGSGGNDYFVDYTKTTGSIHLLSKEQRMTLEAERNKCLADAAYYSALAEGYQHTIDVTKQATLGAITSTVMLFAAPAIGASVGVGYLGYEVAKGIGDIAAEYNGDELSKDTMNTVHFLDYARTIVTLSF